MVIFTFNSIKVQLRLLSGDMFVNTLGSFNSIKVQLRRAALNCSAHFERSFNSIKVQLRRSRDVEYFTMDLLSIP